MTSTHASPSEPEPTQPHRDDPRPVDGRGSTQSAGSSGSGAAGRRIRLPEDGGFWVLVAAGSFATAFALLMRALLA